MWSSGSASDLIVQKTSGWTKQMGEDNREYADVRTSRLVKSTSLQFLASLVHPHSLFDWWISLPQTYTYRANTGEFAVSPAWEVWNMLRAALGGRYHWGRWAHTGPGGMGWGRGELRGDFQHWAGENGREEGNAGWAKPRGMTPRKGVNIAGIWRHQRWFSTAGFNSWVYLRCQLWDCTVARMGAKDLLAILNPCRVARR